MVWNWIWGEKEKKTKLDFKVSDKKPIMINRTLRMSFEFGVEYPIDMDIYKVIEKVIPSFDAPFGVTITDASLVHVDILGGSDV